MKIEMPIEDGEYIQLEEFGCHLRDRVGGAKLGRYN
jgi:hypothetical protein